MRARLVLITALCGAAFLTGACQQDTADSRYTDGPDTSGQQRSTSAESTTGTTSSASSTASTGTTATSVRTVFDPRAMQTAVLRLLEDDYGIDRVQQVTCPPGQEVVDGNTFPCTVVVDGEVRQVEVTVVGDEGEYVVSRPE